MAIRSVTRCSRPSPTGCARSSGRATCSRARAATSSRCSSAACPRRRRGVAADLARRAGRRAAGAAGGRRPPRAGPGERRRRASTRATRPPPTTCCATPTPRCTWPRRGGKGRYHVHRAEPGAGAPARVPPAAARPAPTSPSWTASSRAARCARSSSPSSSWAAARSRLRGAGARAGGLAAGAPRPAVRRRRGRRARRGARLGLPRSPRSRRAGRRAGPRARRCSSTASRRRSTRRARRGTPRCGTRAAARARPRAGAHRARRHRPPGRAVPDRRAASRAGRGIALDDVGADVRSLALLPFIEPDVIKLDLGLVQDRPVDRPGRDRHRGRRRARAHGAQVLAEGIENEHHLAVARALGATLGQGWMFGRPGPLPAVGRRAAVRRARPGRRSVRAPRRSTVVGAAPARRGHKALLLPISHQLENRALRIGEGAVILSAFQRRAPLHARHHPALRVARAQREPGRRVRRRAGGEPVPGVRGADSRPTTRWRASGASSSSARTSRARWSPATSATPTAPDRDRRFAFATVYDRGLVIAAARTLSPASRRADAGGVRDARPGGPHCSGPPSGRG